jgi:transcriptional regulator with XRE-family HTH domain
LSKGKARKSSDAASQLMAIWHKVWETEIYGIDYYARLREDLVRSRKPKSLRTIGKEVGTSHAFIQKLEEGQRPLPSGPTLVTILRAIGMDEREIFDTVASRLIDPREAIGLATGEVMLLEATQVSGLDVVHFPGTLQTGQSPKFHLLGGVNPRAIEFGAYAIPTWANDQSPSRGDNSACAAALEKGSVPSRHGKSVPSARPAESDLARTDMGKEIAEDGMKYDECIEIDDAGRNVVEDETMTVPKWAQMPIELD